MEGLVNRSAGSGLGENACYLKQPELAHKGVGHITEGPLTLHNLMDESGINAKPKKTELNSDTYAFFFNEWRAW